MPATVGFSTKLPLVVWVPLQPPEAVQLVAWIEVQVSVAELPSGMEAAVNASVGTTSAVSA